MNKPQLQDLHGGGSDTTAKLRCPGCGKWESAVTDTRGSNNSIRRRRRCLNCRERFTTFETTEGNIPDAVWRKLRLLREELATGVARIDRLLELETDHEKA